MTGQRDLPVQTESCSYEVAPIQGAVAVTRPNEASKGLVSDSQAQWYPGNAEGKGKRQVPSSLALYLSTVQCHSIPILSGNIVRNQTLTSQGARTFTYEIHVSVCPSRNKAAWTEELNTGRDASRVLVSPISSGSSSDTFFAQPHLKDQEPAPTLKYDHEVPAPSIDCLGQFDLGN